MARRTGRPSYLSDKADVRHRGTARIVVVAGAIALVTALLGGLIGYGGPPGRHRGVHREHQAGRGEAGRPADRGADRHGPPRARPGFPS
ncbi:hypothetical protein NKG94_14855 [Micromonospora sp. M12]